MVYSDRVAQAVQRYTLYVDTLLRVPRPAGDALWRAALHSHGTKLACQTAVVESTRAVVAANERKTIKHNATGIHFSKQQSKDTLTNDIAYFVALGTAFPARILSLMETCPQILDGGGVLGCALCCFRQSLREWSPHTKYETQTCQWQTTCRIPANAPYAD